MCNLADILRPLGRNSEAATWYQRARDVGAAHGFFSVESSACMGLGMTANDAGRHEEGVELLRNALVAAELKKDKKPCDGEAGRERVRTPVSTPPPAEHCCAAVTHAPPIAVERIQTRSAMPSSRHTMLAR